MTAHHVAMLSALLTEVADQGLADRHEDPASMYDAMQLCEDIVHELQSAMPPSMHREINLHRRVQFVDDRGVPIYD